MKKEEKKLTPDLVVVLLSFGKGAFHDLPSRVTPTKNQEIYDNNVKSLVEIGYLKRDGRTNKESYVLTKEGKERIANHILREKDLPQYTTTKSLGQRFDGFVETATPNAINGFMLSILNQYKLKGLNSITLTRLRDMAQEELAKSNTETSVKEGFPELAKELAQ